MASKEEFDSFLNGMLRAKDIIYSNEPDMILAPMLGTVPLIDSLNAIDCAFDNDKVFYFPASSSIDHVKDIISKSICNILEDKNIDLESMINNDKPYKMLSIDEVVGGGSATKVMKGVKSGINRYARKVAGKYDVKNLQNKFQYKTIGIEDARFRKSEKQREKVYTDAVAEGTIIPVEVDRILTMDDPHYCSMQYVTKQGITKRNYPTIVLRKLHDCDGQPGPYLRFLKNLAVAAGNNPENVTAQNLEKMIDHNHKYVPKEYHAPAMLYAQASLTDYNKEKHASD